MGTRGQKRWILNTMRLPLREVLDIVMIFRNIIFNCVRAKETNTLQVPQAISGIQIEKQRPIDCIRFVYYQDHPVWVSNGSPLSPLSGYPGSPNRTPRQDGAGISWFQSINDQFQSAFFSHRRFPTSVLM